jgi:ribonuclease HI
VATEAIVALYTDGGVFERNPSPIGGVWAWCGVNASNERVIGRVGYLSNEEHGKPVTNNWTETLAIIEALEHMEEGWCGTVYSDSQNAIDRMISLASHSVPSKLRARAKAARYKCERLRFVLVKGHPSRKELAIGVAKGGRPVSEHNVWCDTACAAIKRHVLKRK